MSIEPERHILETHLINWKEFEKYRTQHQNPMSRTLMSFETGEMQEELEDLIHCIIMSELRLRYEISQDEIDLAFDVYEAENKATMIYALYLFERNYIWMQLFNQGYNDVDKHEVRSSQLRDLFKHQLFVTAKIMVKQDMLFEKIGLSATAQLAEKIQETHVIAVQWKLNNFMYELHSILEEQDITWGDNPFKDSEQNARRFNRDNQ